MMKTEVNLKLIIITEDELKDMIAKEVKKSLNHLLSVQHNKGV